MINKSFENVEIDHINEAKRLFYIKRFDNYIDIFRCGIHYLRRGITDPKWVVFPISFSLIKGHKYFMEYEVKATCNMKRSFFLAKGLTTQTFEDPIISGEWISTSIEFISNLDGNASIALTATDMPIAGNHLFIRSLRIMEI